MAPMSAGSSSGEAKSSLAYAIESDRETGDLDEFCLMTWARNSGASEFEVRSPYSMKECIEVKITRLDELLEDYASLPWLLKVDTEGSELSVLEGGAEILSTIDNLVMIIEVHPDNLHRAGNSVKMLFDNLRNLNCEVFILDGLFPVKSDSDIYSWLAQEKKEYANLLGIKGKSPSMILANS